LVPLGGTHKVKASRLTYSNSKWLKLRVIAGADVINLEINLDGLAQIEIRRLIIYEGSNQQIADRLPDLFVHYTT
jgi:hypothetical protein